MKISYDWLTEYVDPGLAPEALAEVLTMGGLEVDNVERIGAALDGVVVGHVLKVRAHPNADRLVLCDVDLGPCTNGRSVQIACGAPNVAEGQKVPVATPGTTLLLPRREDPARRAPVTIEETNLRGEVSQGMICAEDELGLSDDHSGVMVLRLDAETGQPLADYLRAQGLAPRDAVLDIEITPNRPDATSHLGVARDVAALTGTALTRPEVDLPEAGGAAAEQLTVSLQAPEACPRYVGLLVRSVEIKDSPAWLKRRLTALGLHPKNNVVDVTNYVLHECGQPLHAFDLGRIAGAEIVVRLAEEGETLTTLDGRERTLPEGTLLICDAEKPVAVAGVMGGANSEVSETTADVLIESAYFDPSTVRRAAKALGLQTDASYRFERGVDRDGQVWAAARAAELLARLAGGEIVPGLVDAHPAPAPARVVRLRPARANQLLGTALSTDTMTALLEAVGFEVTREEPLEVVTERAREGRSLEVGAEDTVLHCTAPTFRPDVEHEEDLIEEVARLHGYDQIPPPARLTMPARVPRDLPAEALRRRARRLLSGLGFREIYTNSMLRKEQAGRFNTPALSAAEHDGDIVETLKPISQEMAALRPRLLPGLLDVMRHNRNHGQRVLRFFEFGHVFHRTARSSGTAVPGYAEHESFILGLSGPHAPAGWGTDPRTTDFFDLKGAVEVLLGELHIAGVAMRPGPAGEPTAAYHLEVTAGGTPLGSIARVDDAVAADFDLEDAPVFVAELNWSTCVRLAAPPSGRSYAPVSRFPVVERDLAVVVDEGQPVGPLLEAVRAGGAPLLQEASVFDLYRGEGVAAGRKSVAFTLRFAADRTLTDEEVDAQVRAVVEALGNRYGADLRR